MEYLTSAYTDIGIRKNTNQDSYSVITASASMGKIVFAVICDGMGGLEKGEVASAHIIKKFVAWFKCNLPSIIQNQSFCDIKYQWNEIVQKENNTIQQYGKSNNISLGTTLTAALFADDKIYLMHIGDTRFYEICETALKIHTEDQTFVAREIRRGNMTVEQAQTDPRRNVLLQCIGASKIVEPQYLELDVKANRTYMLCSDGFRHKISEQEIIDKFSPKLLVDHAVMLDQSKELVELNKTRKETDNITVLLIKTM